MKVLLRAAFDRFSGYGSDSVDVALHLDKAGVDVHLMPIAVVPPLERQLTDLLTKPAAVADVLLNFVPPDLLAFRRVQHCARKYVAWSMWERDRVMLGDLSGPGWLPLTYPRFRGYDEIMVTCADNADAFRNVDDVTPISVMPLGIDVENWRERAEANDGPVRFLAVGTLGSPRKNIFALLETWQQMKRDLPDFDATLHLHSLQKGLHPGVAEAYGPDVTLSQKPITRAELASLYRTHDVLVSTSRGEGMNKPAMEMLSTGGTVIAGDWGGHREWATPGVTWSVPGEMVQRGPDTQGREFEIDRDALRAAMLQAASDRFDLARRGQVGARLMRDEFAWPVVAGRLIERLERIAWER